MSFAYKKPRNSRTVHALFLVPTFGLLGALLYFALRQTPMENNSLDSFASLHEVYREQGIEGFRREKAALKRMLRSKLSTQVEADASAESLALYLFPDVLSETNFERDVGLELWTPLQDQIERSPGSEESRRLFQEMRANIWNYESPSRSTPQLSPEARQVIRIYEVISAQ